VGGLCLGLWLGATDGRAARVRELGLADMAARADRVFLGQCVERVVLEEPGRRPATRYVFRVLAVLKGVDGPVAEFTVAATPDGRGFAGLPVFEVGERALLLLYPPGSGGRTSPMGLDQGAFRLALARDGSTLAVNGQGNRELFKDVPADLLEEHGLSGRSGGPVGLEALQRLLRGLLARGGPP
jgi:hypothetical protein